MKKTPIHSIPFSRLVLYMVLLGLLPLFFVGYFYIKEKNTWNQVAERIMAIHSLSEQKARKQALNSVVRKEYSGADDFYLENQLESLPFLQKEHEAIERLIQTPSYTGNEAAEKRYAFLLGEANRLQFTEGSVQSGEGLQETLEIQAHPVEVDMHDIKEVLARLEGNRVGKPQILITGFKINRKAHSNGNQVFELNLKLIKREFLH